MVVSRLSLTDENGKGEGRFVGVPFSVLLMELLFATGSGDEVDSKMLASLLLELRLCLSDKIASIENEFLPLLFCCILCFVDFDQYKSSSGIKLLKPKV